MAKNTNFKTKSNKKTDKTIFRQNEMEKYTNHKHFPFLFFMVRLHKNSIKNLSIK